MRCARLEAAFRSFVALPLALALGALAWGAEQADSAAGRPERSYATAAEKVLPCVVRIEATAPADTQADTFQFGRSVGVQSSGCGVIVDPMGIIATNNHMVENVSKLTVELADGRRFEASEIKTDKLTDLAILRIQVDEPLPAAVFGDSEALRVGDPVIAVGSPAGLPLSVSAGIISGKGRRLPSVPRVGFLQTDAAINPGSAGGPLANLDGEVIGLSAAVATGGSGFHGLGFAIPGNLVKRIVSQLIERGRVVRAYLGVSLSELRPEAAKKLGLGAVRGVQVRGVMPGSPAAQAGVQEDDVIVVFSGRRVGTPQDVQEVVEVCPIDSTQKLGILRGGNSQVLDVVMKPFPQQFGPAVPSTPEQDRQGPSAPEEGAEP